jgi:uncharacterized phage protein gp47/JayE
VVVWDGDPGAVADNDIAQVILDTAPAGIALVGDETGVATRTDGSTTTVKFARADVVDIYVSAQIISASGVLSADVKAAIADAMPTLIGGDVRYNKLTAAVFIDGVDDFVFFRIGTAPSPVGTTNISIGNTQIAQLDLSNIVLTGDVS